MIKSVKNEYLSALLNKLFVEDKEFLKQQYRAIPEIGKLMRRIPEELRRASVFKILFYHYYNFDLDQPFLPQYEQNNRSLLHDLRQLALLD